MKAKVGRGSGARGLLNYALDEKKKSQIITSNMDNETPRGLSKEFAISRQLRPGCVRPLLHISLALPTGEHLTKERWQEATEKFLSKMDIDTSTHQYIAVKHNDTDFDHVHIIASRINLSGELWHGQWEAKRAINATHELEKELGLTQTKSLKNPNQQRALTKGEIEMSIRTGTAPPRTVLQHVIKDVLKSNPTVQAFCEQLKESGIGIRPNIASTGRMNGFSFQYDGINFKGSSLGKGYTWQNLQKNGLIYNKDKDTAFLQQLKKQEISNGKGKSDQRNGQDRSEGHSRADQRVANSTDRQRRADGTEIRTVMSGNDNTLNRNSRKNKHTATDRVQDDAERQFKHENNLRELAKRKDSSETDGKTADCNSARSRSRSGQHIDEILTIEKESNAQNSSGYSIDRSLGRDSSSDRLLSYACSVSQKCREREDTTDNRQHADNRQKQSISQRNISNSFIIDHVKKKKDAIEKQLKAINAEKYRITCMHEIKKTFVLGKGRGPEGHEKLYSKEEIKNLVSFLSAKNAQGYNIYITPIDDSKHYILLDDTTHEKITELKKSGFTPALVQETSPGNFQAIFTVEKDSLQKNEQKIANGIVQRLNQKYGDEKLSGVIHPFRLSGFVNRKEKYKDEKNHYPIVGIKDAVCIIDEKMNTLLKDTRNQYNALNYNKEHVQAKYEAQARREALEVSKNANIRSQDRTINDDFRDAYNIQLEHARDKFGNNIDDSIIDYRTCKALIKYGKNPEDVKTALKECSPAVESRHDQLEEYADRTVSKVVDRLEYEYERAEREEHDHGYER